MTMLAQIERVLLGLDAAAFQRLCDAYLARTGLQSWVSIGLATGMQKTRAGTPDTLDVSKAGLTLVEATTERQHLRAKLVTDVTQCLAPEQSGIPIALIRRIILCFTGHLPSSDVVTLQDLVRPHGIELTLVGPHRLAQDLRFRFPSLGQEFLNLPIDTGQLLTPGEFIQAQEAIATQTNLDAPFCGRDAELAAMAEGLEHGGPVLLLGPAGVGKTRLALETVRRASLGASPPSVFCLRSRGASAYADLQAALESSGRYLLLIDDANRVSGLSGLLDIAGERRLDRDIRVVLTVRDYAAEPVLATVQERATPVIVRVAKFSDTEVRHLLETAFGIRNERYKERIAEVAQGNARIAVMAARVATTTETLTSLHDASAVYEQFFEPVRAQCPLLEEADSLRVLATIALSGRLFLDQPEVMAQAAALHGLSDGEFRARVDALHDAELVDLYENAVARVGDQVLATYVVYLVLFKRGLIDLPDVLQRLYRIAREPLLEQLRAAVRTFRQPAVGDRLDAAVHAVWDQAEGTWPADVFESFVLTFAGVRPRQALQIAIGSLAAAQPEAAPADLRVTISHQENVNDTPTLILARFRDDAVLRPIALHALLDEAERRPARVPALLRLTWEAYGYSRHSDWRRLEAEHELFDVLWDRAAEGRAVLASRIFLALAGRALQTQHDEHESTRDGMGLTIYRFDLPNAEGVRHLRGMLCQRMRTLLSHPELRPALLQTVRAYATGGLRMADATLIVEDLRVLEPSLLSSLAPDGPEDVAVARELRLLRQRLRLGIPPGYAPILGSPLARLADLLLRDRELGRQRGWSAMTAIREARLQGYGNRLLADDLGSFLERVGTLLRVYTDHNAWQVREGAVIVLRAAAPRYPEAFRVWFARVLAEGNPCELHPQALVDVAVRTLGRPATRELLETAPTPARVFWLRIWFDQLPADGWTPAEADVCACLIEGGEPRQIWRVGSLIDRICAADLERGAVLIRRLVGRIPAEPEVAHAVADDFYDRGCLQRPIGEIFRAEPALFEALYTAADTVDPHLDHDGAIFSELVSLQPGAAVRWVEHITAHEDADPHREDHRHYAPLWRRADWYQVMGDMCRAVIADSRSPWFRDSYLRVLLGLTDGTPDAAELAQRQDVLLRNLILEAQRDADRMRRLFAAIAHLPEERRGPLIGCYLATDPPVAEFEHLALEPSGWGWSGSQVPVLQRRRAFFEQLLAYCCRPALLAHGAVLEARCRELDDAITRERRADFVGHR